MKKFVLVLALVALATPAWAGVTVSCTAGSDADCNLITVSYNNTEANNVRAFALNISVSTGTIVSASNYNADYDIYPGQVVIVDGVITEPNTPVCKSTYPDTLGGLGTTGMTIEMASLYHQGVEPVPAKSGTLLKFRVSGSSGTITIAGNSTRGGAVIMENPDQVITPTLTGCVINCVTLPGKATNPDPEHLATGVSATHDLFWTAGSGATSRDVYFGTVTPPETKVIADGTVLTYDTGTMSNGGKTYYWQVNEKNSGGTTTGDIWRFTTVNECLKNTATEYSQWVLWGKPNCWCYKRQCRGDGNGTKNIGGTVQSLDLAMFRTAFNKNDTVLTTITNGICSDYNHTKNIGGRVQSLDLGIFRTYFNKNDTICTCCDIDANCVLTDADKYNFWTN